MDFLDGFGGDLGGAMGSGIGGAAGSLLDGLNGGSGGPGSGGPGSGGTLDLGSLLGSLFGGRSSAGGSQGGQVDLRSLLSGSRAFGAQGQSPGQNSPQDYSALFQAPPTSSDPGFQLPDPSFGGQAYGAPGDNTPPWGPTFGNPAGYGYGQPGLGASAFGGYGVNPLGLPTGARSGPAVADGGPGVGFGSGLASGAQSIGNVGAAPAFDVRPWLMNGGSPSSAVGSLGDMGRYSILPGDQLPIPGPQPTEGDPSDGDPQIPSGHGRLGTEAIASGVAILLNALDKRHQAGTDALNAFHAGLTQEQKRRFDEAVQAQQQEADQAKSSPNSELLSVPGFPPAGDAVALGPVAAAAGGAAPSGWQFGARGSQNRASGQIPVSGPSLLGPARAKWTSILAQNKGIGGNAASIANRVASYDPILQPAAANILTQIARGGNMAGNPALNGQLVSMANQTLAQLDRKSASSGGLSPQDQELYNAARGELGDRLRYAQDPEYQNAMKAIKNGAPAAKVKALYESRNHGRHFVLPPGG